MRLLGEFIFLGLFLLFVVGWLLAWALFKTAGAMIHFLLIFAVVSLILHLFRGKSAA